MSEVENQAWIFPGLYGFTQEDNTVYLLSNRGSDTEWYKNMLADPVLKIFVNGLEIPAKGIPLTYSNGVDGVVERFKSK